MHGYGFSETTGDSRSERVTSCLFLSVGELEKPESPTSSMLKDRLNKSA